MKRELGQFYTKNADYIIGDLITDLPTDGIFIDPFSGEWDLLNLLPERSRIEAYDIDPKHPLTIKRDTLLNPPSYKGKWVLTNPPYLARNKTKEKSIYETWGVDDLYKAAIKSIIGCEGGILIVPLNFLCSSDPKTRIEFLSKYTIQTLKIFETRAFKDTDYTVCSFSFKKSARKEQKINTFFIPSKINKSFSIKKETGYRLGWEFHSLLSSVKSNIKVSRETRDKPANTDLVLRAIDTGTDTGRISLSLNPSFSGKQSDRTFAKINLSITLTEQEQLILAQNFNNLLEYWRNKYNSLFLSNYRNAQRKRISFKDAFKVIQHCLNQ